MTAKKTGRRIIVCLDEPPQLVCSDTFELKELAKPENYPEKFLPFLSQKFLSKNYGVAVMKNKVWEELQALKLAIEKGGDQKCRPKIPKK